MHFKTKYSCFMKPMHVNSLFIMHLHSFTLFTCIKIIIPRIIILDILSHFQFIQSSSYSFLIRVDSIIIHSH